MRAQLAASDAAVRSRRTSPRVHRPDVADRVAGAARRRWNGAPAAYPARRAAQQARLELPLFPTTTIGSFPQTAEVRQARAALGARRRLTADDYERTVEGWIDDAVRWQEEIGLDVLVHGEFERNDMVKYFGEQLERLRLHPARLGAVLWQPLRRAADHLGRRRAARRR